MPEVIIANLSSKSIHCEAKREKLLHILLRETDWRHACGGKGRCTTCKASVLNGSENLSPMTPNEEQFIKLDKLQSNQRLACQAEVLGDIEIEVPKETKLPHLSYSY